MNDTLRSQPNESVGPELARSRELLDGIRTDLQSVHDAEAGLKRALDCLRAGLDERFLDELQQVAKAYLDSERGRLFAMRNSSNRINPSVGRRA